MTQIQLSPSERKTDVEVLRTLCMHIY